MRKCIALVGRIGIACATIIISIQSSLVGVEREPLLLWNNDEIAALKETVASNEPWVQQRLQEMREWRRPKLWYQLFATAILDDDKARQAVKKQLLQIVGKHPKQFEEWEHGGLHYDTHMAALTYDLIYHDLSEDERDQIEATFREHIAYQLTDEKVYNHISWLPNMQWPRPMSAAFMALALRDEALIRDLWAANGGWKMYFDRCMVGRGFYQEEFGKMTAMTGQKLLYARGLRRLGLDELGFGYVGANGATLENFLMTFQDILYPRIEIPGGMPHYAQITMGDSKGGGLGRRKRGDTRIPPPHVFQRNLIPGYLSDGETGGVGLFFGYNMTGRDQTGKKVQKFQAPLIFELAHQIWPDHGFDYFLAQMRRPDQDAYYPALLLGGQPIPASSVTPPAAPSFVSQARGLSFLRADQSSTYWSSDAPAVSLSHATLYVHYTADCFSLLGYVAFNRHIYLNRPISHGYNGGPYDFHVRAHTGVVVDGLQAEPIGPLHSISDFNDHVQFNKIWTDPSKAAYTGDELRSSDDKKRRVTQVYPGVEMARSLLLRDEYLFDVFYLESDKPRTYHWLAHAIGEALPEDPSQWKASDELQTSLFNHPSMVISDAQVHETDDSWSIVTQQNYLGDDITTSRLGSEWYDRQIGVKVHGLAEPKTKAWTYVPPRSYTPGSDRGPRNGEMRQHDEAGGINIAIEREAHTTAFVVLHEKPFEQGSARITSFKRIAQNDSAVVAMVNGVDRAGVAYEDIIMIRFDRNSGTDETVEFQINNDRFVFHDYAWLRRQHGHVTVKGDLKQLITALGIFL